MRKLELALGERSYSILIGPRLLADGDAISSCLDSRRAVIVSNETVAPLYLERLAAPLRERGVSLVSIILPDGELHKNAETLGRIYDTLMAERCDRTTTLIALGGGVIGDLAGYAAATYQRGIPFIQVPTTLLSQVDSSVGGKTGINHPRGKNMIGAFWQPRLVLADTDTLATLPPRELSAGLAEVIKYGIIRDEPFFRWLEDHMDNLVAREAEALSYAIERSCANKAEVVAGDERETARDGGRALLNLGHTFGHAIEAGLGYGQWLHGEAVAAGTVMAAELSRRLGWLSATDLERIRQLLARAGLPISGPALGAARYLDLMGHDKKVLAGRLRLVLPKGIGTAVTWGEVPEAEIRAAIDACCHG
ncbi:3-dehydroquinate synthase [Denitratisoma oestradiolicum]|uniref:3-dehydroquinate synthase n=1 Tax=Denitratisoma oestradiolicum TaxID=311182 RepID=A0A6S6XZE4_9PROT|nr:3-dehydroquinate synthase [Denitratisoma oestradiolicum]TWO80021.1 3-dehydroquinate synthase [Denitratisoma oestradiolicum]CAB1369789.1 3-dehydroquinate synthase [Denitratisoma oestradiolicum]